MLSKEDPFKEPTFKDTELNVFERLSLFALLLQEINCGHRRMDTYFILDILRLTQEILIAISRVYFVICCDHDLL